MLKERVQAFIQEFEMPVTVFCRKVKLSTVSYYQWLKGTLNFSEETEGRIRQYIEKYGF